MYKDVLRAIEGIDIFPVISLILFFSFFIGLIYYVMKTDKEKWDRAAQLPLHSDNGATGTGNSKGSTTIDSKN